ncbi:two pore domain potassium channel family protein [Nocardioides guangzhouensis]|uniref:Two pore domain potassium channel family protein n=1 Tax=Nocardioides guangzhouensis TaxID=2497878 RepID=A0A4Q4ZG33_9ACTN|nr:two pore domain potassium channel family protein [Nocardioides guangzhouensis]
MSNSAPSTFSEPLNHTRALYFTTTVFASVGFGDITAETDRSRALVSTQMILDLVILGAVVRRLVTAVRTRLHRSGTTRTTPNP